MVPAGKSTGKGEAIVVSTQSALKNILEIQKVLIAKKFGVFDQKEIDKLLMANLDK
ncbi:MAG: hypothetical protein PHP14_03855 [Candidatus Pacebacteria bacterium]|nr:hypothetical protein [Candidatus Paceibacterota bacterium]